MLLEFGRISCLGPDHPALSPWHARRNGSLECVSLSPCHGSNPRGFSELLALTLAPHRLPFHPAAHYYTFPRFAYHGHTSPPHRAALVPTRLPGPHRARADTIAIIITTSNPPRRARTAIRLWPRSAAALDETASRAVRSMPVRPSIHSFGHYHAFPPAAPPGQSPFSQPRHAMGRNGRVWERPRVCSLLARASGRGAAASSRARCVLVVGLRAGAGERYGAGLLYALPVLTGGVLRVGRRRTTAGLTGLSCAYCIGCRLAFQNLALPRPVVGYVYHS